MKPDELSSIHDKLRNLNLSYKTTSEELEKHYSGIGSASEVIEVVQERREFLRNTSGVNRAINAQLQNLEEDMRSEGKIRLVFLFLVTLKSNSLRTKQF